MFIRNKKGQTTAEYAILFSLVLAAAIAMQIYVKRGMQAKMKSGTDAYTSVSGTITSAGLGSADFGDLDQYEPYYQESSYDRYQESIEQEHMGAGKVIKEKVSDVSGSATGGYDQQVSGANKAERDARDAVWEQ